MDCLTSMTNLLINVGFLVLIGILFIVSAVSFGRLNRCTKELVNATEQMQKEYQEIFVKQEADAYLWKLVKAADKLSAYIKCTEEEQAGNREFINAKEMALNHILQMELPEAELFLEYFMDSYGRNLDELTGGET